MFDALTLEELENLQNQLWVGSVNAFSVHSQALDPARNELADELQEIFESVDVEMLDRQFKAIGI